jgi:hypothetical protein
MIPDRADRHAHFRATALAFTVVPTESRIPELLDVHGLVVDWGHGDFVTTTVCLADGSTSLYLSNGGGVIGAGEHDAVRSASLAALRTAASVRNHLELLGPSVPAAGRSVPLPDANAMRFTLLTTEGARSAEVSVEALTSDTPHVLSGLGDAVQQVLFEINQADASRPDPAGSWWDRMWRRLFGRS